MVGPVTASQRRHLNTDSKTLRITAPGQVDRSIALAELAAADATLILADDHPWWIGRKVFEALAYYSQRILAIVPDGDTSELLVDSEKTWSSKVDLGHVWKTFISNGGREVGPVRILKSVHFFGAIRPDDHTDFIGLNAKDTPSRATTDSDTWVRCRKRM